MKQIRKLNSYSFSFEIFALTAFSLLQALFVLPEQAVQAQVPLPGSSAESAPSQSNPGYSAPAVRGNSPLPGTVQMSTSSAPAPVPGGAAPAPGPSGQDVISTAQGGYRRLPINYKNAAVRLEELRNVMLTVKPKEFQAAISDYLDWLSDLADGHWKIYQSFAKVDSMKAQAELEKSTTLKLGSLKRQAMLLKAEFLIRNNRQPEALQPLIDIVSAEPKTATGEAAYNMLKDIGFSEELPLTAPGSPQSNLPAKKLQASPNSQIVTRESKRIN